jgi:mRNA-degrading endonuclease YafQ of YafQ-DinJ toxin-antitoxin module
LKDPYDPKLDIHSLQEAWEGYQGFRIGDRKNDYLAVYKEIQEGNDNIARFVALGTHKELFA